MKKLLWSGLVVVLILAAACGQGASPGVTQPPATAAAVAPPEGPATADWQKKWDAVLAAAKREGSITVYGDVNPSFRQEIEQGFARKYQIQPEWVVGKAPEISVRWERERGAGIDAVDVYHMGPATPLLVMKPKGAFGPLPPHTILPEVTDPNAWPGGKIPYLDKDRTIVPLNAAWTTYTAVNTDQVKEGQIKSYKDLLRPEWKDKIAIYDPSITGAGGGWATLILTNAFGLEGGTEFLKQFAATKPLIMRDARLLVEWVAKGKYPIGVGVSHAIVSEFMAVGAPIAFARVAEGGNINPGGACLEVAAKPPHPNAATVYINWLLTREGQVATARGLGAPPVRIDALKDVDPNLLFTVAGPNDKAYWTDEDFFMMQGKAVAIAKDIFAPK